MSRRPAVEGLEERCVPSNNQAYVSALYQDLLGRTPDPGGLAAFSSALDQGQASRLQVVQAIQNSLEYQTRVVQNLYQQLLKRSADPAGLNAAVSFLAHGGSALQLEVSLLASDEYFTNRGGGTNSGFLQALYQDTLGRPIDPSGQQTFSQLLATGMSRAQVAQLILNSPEGTTVEVQNLYRQSLKRNADSTGMTFFVNALQTRQTSSNASASNASASNASTSNASASADRNMATNTNTNASGSAERVMTMEQATARVLASDEFFARATQ